MKVPFGTTKFGTNVAVEKDELLEEAAAWEVKTVVL